MHLKNKSVSEARSVCPAIFFPPELFSPSLLLLRQNHDDQDIYQFKNRPTIHTLKNNTMEDMKYIVLDLEATCWQDRNNGKRSEIIEIGAVAVDSHGETTGEFSEFVKPVLHPVLSDFAKKLTTIQQEDIDTARPFEEVIASFWDWIGVDELPYLLCSWGFYDRRQLTRDCELHGLDTTWLEPHISLKHQYQRIRNLRRPVGMGKALRMESLQLHGTHHRGIDDARNIAKIFKKHIGAWEVQ